MKDKPVSRDREVAGKVADALMEIMRHQYTAAIGHGPPEENDLAELDKLMEGLATCDGLETHENAAEKEVP